MRLNQEQAIFLFVNDMLPSSSALVSALYAQNKDPDGFLYMTYSAETSFGEEEMCD